MEAVEAVEAVKGISECDEAVEEASAQTVGRKRKPGTPCTCTFPGPCYGREFKSRDSLAVHVAKKNTVLQARQQKRQHTTTCYKPRTEKKRRMEDLQGFLAHKKQPPPRTLQ